MKNLTVALLLALTSVYGLPHIGRAFGQDRPVPPSATASPPPKSVPAPPAGAGTVAQSALAELREKADAVVVVEVERVWESPGRWSGYVAALQNVDYKVLKAFKGSIEHSKITVGFHLDPQGQLVEREKPELSKKIFSVGKHHVLFIKVDAERWYFAPAVSHPYYAPNDYVGVVEANEAVADYLQKQ